MCATRSRAMGNNSPFSYIRAGEGPEKLKGGMIISAGRIFLRVEVTQILLSAVNFNNGAPLTPALVPTNAFQSAFVMRAGSHILRVLATSGQTEIGTTIIQAITICVINFDLWWRLQNETMKPHLCLSACAYHL